MHEKTYKNVEEKEEKVSLLSGIMDISGWGSDYKPSQYRPACPGSSARLARRAARLQRSRSRRINRLRGQKLTS